MSERSVAEKSVESIVFGNMYILKELTKIHQYTQQNNIDILYNIYGSLLNQSHVTFQPPLYTYGCARICKWDVNGTEQIFRQKFEFAYFRKLRSRF